MNEVERYLLKNYRHLLTNEERLALHWLQVQEKAAISSTSRIPTSLRDRLGPKLTAEITQNPKRFVAWACERILREHRSEIHLNRCPKCHALCQTPKAQQCLVCHHSWRS